MTNPRNLAPSGAVLSDASSRPPDVAVIQLRLPTFVRKNPHVWFAKVEAVSDLQRVTSETTRFRHLLCNLPPEVADEVADVIGAPLNDAPYQRLKQSILDRTTASETARLRRLLTHKELGDRRPSHHATARGCEQRGLEQCTFKGALSAALAAVHSHHCSCCRRLHLRPHH
ncbi:hypothetical protein HPB48_025527 [Haemaphysalis longicornis]|uniref:DUF7041 domain-containing protein n=1 Tax=Haemaphysalis longicornis TaxID=44386 RepID=A0A9J6H9R1_HAELO|nr:hypothetical protein HPB48_025527 [Haemaphysalis longicornis]